MQPSLPPCPNSWANSCAFNNSSRGFSAFWTNSLDSWLREASLISFYHLSWRNLPSQKALQEDPRLTARRLEARLPENHSIRSESISIFSLNWLSRLWSFILPWISVREPSIFLLKDWTVSPEAFTTWTLAGLESPTELRKTIGQDRSSIIGAFSAFA